MVTSNKAPVYDNDYVTLEYLKEVINADKNEKSKDLRINKNYGTQPVPPYYLNDTWTNNGKIYVCIKSRVIGTFVLSDWELVGTDDTAVEDIRDYIVNENQLEIPKQVDGKIESYSQDTDPSIPWDTYTEKERHRGDLWEKGDKQYIYKRLETNPVTYEWVRYYVNDTMFNDFGAKKNIFVDIPYDYKQLDLWFCNDTTGLENIEIGDLLISNSQSSEYDPTHWTKNETKVISIKTIDDLYYNKTEIDNFNYDIETNLSSQISQTQQDISVNVGKIATLTNDLNTLEVDINNKLKVTAEGVFNAFSTIGGENYLKNTTFSYRSDGFQLDNWTGDCRQINYENAVSLYAGIVGSNILKQEISLINTIYTLSFKYRRLLGTSTPTVTFNNKTIELTNDNDTEIVEQIEINNGIFTIEFTSNINNSLLIYDVCLNAGPTKIRWVQSANELTTESVSISNGIKVDSNKSNTLATMNTDGFRVKNKTTENVVMRATDTGADFEHVNANSGVIGGISFQPMSNGHRWISGVK